MQYKLLALSTVKPEREIFTMHIHAHSSREKGKKKKLTFITLHQSTAEIPFQTNSYWVILDQY